jgi:hypothetical protein
MKKFKLLFILLIIVSCSQNVNDTQRNIENLEFGAVLKSSIYTYPYGTIWIFSDHDSIALRKWQDSNGIEDFAIRFTESIKLRSSLQYNFNIVVETATDYETIQVGESGSGASIVLRNYVDEENIMEYYVVFQARVMDSVVKGNKILDLNLTSSYVKISTQYQLSKHPVT